MYATIARNLSVGVGSLWRPVVTDTFMADFHEHPPLAFWLEGMLFYVFGDQLCDRARLRILCGSVTAAALVGIWRELHCDNRQGCSCGWLPIMFWIPCGVWCIVQ